jgi:magnesium transporter
MSVEAIISRSDGSDSRVSLEPALRRQLSDDKLVWIDLEGSPEKEIERAAEVLRLSEGTRNRLTGEIGQPQAVAHDECFEVVVAAIEPEDLQPIALQILVGENWVVTRHDGPIAFLADHRERVLDSRELGRLAAIEFLLVILDWHIGTFFEAAESLERAIDRLDDQALTADSELLRGLVRLRRRIAAVRRILSPQREVFAELSRPDFLPKGSSHRAELLGGVSGRLDRALDAVGNARELLIGSFDIHMTRTAQRTNDVMRILTVVSVVLLPAIVIAGVMGMNFKVGFFESPTNFWIVVAAMLALAAGTLGFARWRGWM